MEDERCLEADSERERELKSGTGDVRVARWRR